MYMKLFNVLKNIIKEYIHPRAIILYETVFNEKKFIFYDSPHLYDIRKETRKVRLTDTELLVNMCKNIVSPMYSKYYLSGKKFREIELDDPRKIRFGVLKKMKDREAVAIIQMEEFSEREGFTFVVITFFDEKGLTLRGLENKFKVRFILEI